MRMLIKKLIFLLNVIICYFPERRKTKHIITNSRVQKIFVLLWFFTETYNKREGF